MKIYFPARRCQRVAFSIFLCFFLRMRFLRFLIRDPMSDGRLAVSGSDRQVASELVDEGSIHEFRACRP